MSVLWSMRPSLSLCFALLGTFAGFEGWQPLVGQQPGPGNTALGLKIVVLEGEEGINVIKKRTAVKPVVEIRDKNNLPIAGVAVVISLGAFGVFDSGQHTASLVTDATGRISAPSFRPLTQGPFSIEVKATYQGQTVTAAIRQTNFSTIASAVKAGKTPGSSSSTASGSSAPGAGTGTAAPSAGAAAGGSAGLSGLAIGGIVAGVAAAGAIAAVVATKNKKDCPSDQARSALQQHQQLCAVIDPTTLAQCDNADIQASQALSAFCTCQGLQPAASDHDGFINLVNQPSSAYCR